MTRKKATEVQLLLNAGANPNTRYTDAEGQHRAAPAVQFAAANGSVEVLRLLAKAGADLNAADATGRLSWPPRTWATATSSRLS